MRELNPSVEFANKTGLVYSAVCKPLCQKLHLFFQVFNFFRRYQHQMTAFHAAILHDRQIAQATDMQLRLYSWG